MRKLVADAPAEGLVLRFLDPRLARILEALPPFGQLTITMVDGRPQKKFTVSRDFLDHEEGSERSWRR